MMLFASASTDLELFDRKCNFSAATVRRVFETYAEAAKHIRTAQKKKKNIPLTRGFVIGQMLIVVHSPTADNIPYDRELINAPYVAIYEPVRLAKTIRAETNRARMTAMEKAMPIRQSMRWTWKVIAIGTTRRMRSRLRWMGKRKARAIDVPDDINDEDEEMDEVALVWLGLRERKMNEKFGSFGFSLLNCNTAPLLTSPKDLFASARDW